MLSSFVPAAESVPILLGNALASSSDRLSVRLRGIKTTCSNYRIPRRDDQKQPHQPPTLPVVSVPLFMGSDFVKAVDDVVTQCQEKNLPVLLFPKHGTRKNRVLLSTGAGHDVVMAPNGNITVQKRGFRTRPAGALGLANPAVEGEKSRVMQFFKLKLASPQGKGKESEQLKRLVENLPKDQADKIKISFAEGFLVGQCEKPATAQQGGRFSFLFNADSAKTIGNRVFTWVVTIIVVVAILRFLMNHVVVQYRSDVGVEVSPEEVMVTFDDVRANEEAKDELKEVVDFLKDPNKYIRLGGRLPKGLLLVGPPGTGKTLLARAVAGEAGVPFFHASGSEFDEMLVGQGAKRVRELFAAAKERAPCVIFIDEIDSVGMKRSNSTIHPFANQTINQLLNEMDGFQQNEGVVVLGATNRKGDLDKALLRPGRFDVEVYFRLPDLSGRVDILDLYLGRVTVDRDVNVERLAKGTTGFTGADLENLVNLAAVRAAADGHSTVPMSYFETARDKILMGPERKRRIPDEETNKNTAYHEAGHTLVAYHTKHAEPLHKVTIIPRADSLGHTSFISEKDQFQFTRAQLLARMDVGMGGRAAEELIFGTDLVTTGASDDLQKATAIATSIVKELGMSDKLGLRTFTNDQQQNALVVVNDVGETTSELIDAEIKRLLNESYERAKLILQKHATAHRRLAEALLQYETLDTEEIRDVVEGRAIKRPPTVPPPSTPQLISPPTSTPLLPGVHPMQPQHQPLVVSVPR